MMKYGKGNAQKPMFFAGAPKMQMDNVLSTGKGGFVSKGSGMATGSAPKASVKKPSIGFGIGSGVSKSKPKGF